MFLFRPVGYHELELIRQLEFKAFPPRLEIQPIFYPVLNEDYAIQIAKEWNTRDKSSGYVCYVTRFEVNDEYLSKFERKIVGAKVHEELWVPAEELDEFNSQIVGKIEVTQAFHSIEYIRLCRPSFSNYQWESQRSELMKLEWSLDNKIACHDHCELCTSYLCSDHPAATGNEWARAFVANHPNDYTLYLCPPCFRVLQEQYGLKETKVTEK